MKNTLREVVLVGVDLEIDDLKYLLMLHRVTSLDVSDNHIGNEGVEMIANSLKDLKKLGIGQVGLEDEGIRHLEKLPQLTELDVSCNKFTISVLVNIIDSSLKKLNTLSIFSCSVNDECMKEITTLSQLTSLSAGINTITENSLKIIGHSMRDLTYLDVSGNEISDQGVEWLCNLKKLKELYISSNNLSSIGLEFFKSMNQLRSFQCDQINIMKQVSEMSHLETLIINNCKINIEVFESMSKNMNNLTHLILNINSVIDSDALRFISSLKRLNELRVEGCSINDSTLEALCSAQHLKHLFISKNEITDNGVKHLVRLPCLRTLDISNNPISLEGVKIIASSSLKGELASLTISKEVIGSGASLIRLMNLDTFHLV